MKTNRTGRLNCHDITWIQFHVFNHEIMFECCAMKSWGREKWRSWFWWASAQLKDDGVSTHCVRMVWKLQQQSRHLRIIQHSRRFASYVDDDFVHSNSLLLESASCHGMLGAHLRVICHLRNADENDTILRFFTSIHERRARHDESSSFITRNFIHFQGHKNKVWTAVWWSMKRSKEEDNMRFWVLCSLVEDVWSLKKWNLSRRRYEMMLMLAEIAFHIWLVPTYASAAANENYEKWWFSNSFLSSSLCIVWSWSFTLHKTWAIAPSW